MYHLYNMQDNDKFEFNQYKAICLITKLKSLLIFLFVWHTMQAPIWNMYACDYIYVLLRCTYS